MCFSQLIASITSPNSEVYTRCTGRRLESIALRIDTEIVLADTVVNVIRYPNV